MKLMSDLGKEISAFEKTASFLDENRPLRYGVGFDGSRLSEKCFQVCCNMADQDRGDRIYVLHVETNKDVPAALEAERRQKQVQLLADKAGVKITWYKATQQEDESICTSLMRLVEKVQVDFVILGCYGLTAEGDQVEMNNFLKEKGTLSQTSDESLRSADTSVVLVKTTAFKLAESRRFVLATDNSSAAKSAFALILRMVRDGDIVHVIYASATVKQASWLGMYEEELGKLPGVQGKVEVLQVPNGLSVLDTITKFSKEVEADFLVTGIADYKTGKPLGSVSMGIARDTRCTTILIKDPHEVTEHRISKSNLEKYLANAALY